MTSSWLCTILLSVWIKLSGADQRRQLRRKDIRDNKKKIRDANSIGITPRAAATGGAVASGMEVDGDGEGCVSGGRTLPLKDCCKDGWSWDQWHRSPEVRLSGMNGETGDYIYFDYYFFKEEHIFCSKKDSIKT